MGQAITPEMMVYDLVQAVDPQIAPDGERILYTLAKTERATQAVTSQLWVCDREGGNARRISWSGERNGGARWSPDGRQIAFLSDRGGKPGIYVMGVGGGEAREVTSHGGPIVELA